MGNSRGKLFCVILAAGLGTRMDSSVPKVLHRIYGKPLLLYSLEAVKRLGPAKTVVVVGKDHGPIKENVGAGVSFAVQKEQKGTAHALASAVAQLKDARNGTVLVTNGDTPLISAATLRKFLGLHAKHKNAVSVLSFEARDPYSYGRVLRDAEGRPLKVVEEKDATEREKTVREVNSGVYAIEAGALHLIKDIKLNRKKGEYYLTDIVETAAKKGVPIGVFCVGRKEEFLGVNTRKDLERAHKVVRENIVAGWLDRGVSFIDASSVHIGPDVKIGADTLIYPNVFIEGDTRVGRNCTIYPNVRIAGSVIKNGAVIKDTTVIEFSIVGASAQVGPFAHIRPESRIGESAKIGNFVELKKSSVGRGSKAMHLSYIGDAALGRDVNIGAGTITCNYDGRKKHITRIENGVFVGSDTQFVAPVRVGKGAYIGAGSTITKDVPPGVLALSRAKQTHLKKKS